MSHCKYTKQHAFQKLTHGTDICTLEKKILSLTLQHFIIPFMLPNNWVQCDMEIGNSLFSLLGKHFGIHVFGTKVLQAKLDQTECLNQGTCVSFTSKYIIPQRYMRQWALNVRKSQSLCFGLLGDAVVTPLRKAASYEPRIAILGIWGDTWLTCGKYGIYVAVCGSYGALTGSTWRLLPRKISPIYCRDSYVAVTKIPSLVLRNTWNYVIIRYSYGELPKFDLCCSYEAALRKGVTTA